MTTTMLQGTYVELGKTPASHERRSTLHLLSCAQHKVSCCDYLLAMHPENTQTTFIMTTGF